MANPMNGQNDLIPQPQMGGFEAEADFVVSYDRKHDILLMIRRSMSHKPAVSVDVNGEFWLRMDPESGEVFGVEIEDFEGHFLKEHPKLGVSWPEVRRLLRKQAGAPEPSTVRPIAREVGDLVRAHPAQLRFA
jgi:hypothetical protein